MKRLLIVFVVADLLLLAGVIVFLTVDEEAQQPASPATDEVVLERPVPAPTKLSPPERSVVPHALPDSELLGEAELEAELRKAVAGSDWPRVVELQDKLAVLRRERNEEMLREMNRRQGWALGRPEDDEPLGIGELRRVRLRAVAPEADDGGAAPMPFGRGMFGPWDTGRKAETP
jgi:hypothetical protein